MPATPEADRDMQNAVHGSPPVPGLLIDCWRDFRGLAWHWHLLALSILVAALAGSAMPILFSAAPTIDEATYESAFAAVAAGRSPYGTPGYFYPPAFAFAGARAVEALGVSGARLLLRGLNVVGAALTCWLAAAWWWSPSSSVRARVTERLLVALVLMLVSPCVGAGLASGNFSLVVSSWINLALHAAHAWPVVSGVLLGASLITKPLAAIVLPIFAGAATARRDGRKIAPATVLVAAAICFAGLLLLPYFRQLLEVRLHSGTFGGTISLLRVAWLLGLDLHQGLLLILIAPFAFVAGRRWAADRVALIALALAMVMFTSPATWPYTATVFFPVPVMAVSVVRARLALRGGASQGARSPLLDQALVGALAVSVLFLNGGAFDRLPAGVQLTLLLAQVAAPVWLAGYVLRSAGSWESGAVRESVPDRLSP